jgi:deoxyadenosine/deoxycytidine kinase
MKICIEGNIGCGKTSVIRKIHEVTRLPVFLEPVDEWADWLDLFYNDPTRWGFTFNLNVLMTFNQWSNLQCKALYERSPLSCRKVFAQLQHINGDVSDLEIELLDKLYSQLKWQPDVIIYLRADPEVCMERMTTRGRSCENNVKLEYLEDVHALYEDMIDKTFNKNIRVHTIDANRDADLVFQDVLRIVKNFVL